MSYGYSTALRPFDFTLDEIQTLYANGCVMIAATGNPGDTVDPAYYGEVLGVGQVGPSGNSTVPTTGAVDIYAPGSNIPVAACIEQGYVQDGSDAVNLLLNYGRNMGGTWRALDAINATY